MVGEGVERGEATMIEVTRKDWLTTLKEWQARAKGIIKRVHCGFCEAHSREEDLQKRIISCKRCDAYKVCIPKESLRYKWHYSAFPADQVFAQKIVDWLIAYGKRKGWKT